MNERTPHWWKSTGTALRPAHNCSPMHEMRRGREKRERDGLLRYSPTDKGEQKCGPRGDDTAEGAGIKKGKSLVDNGTSQPSDMVKELKNLHKK